MVYAQQTASAGEEDAASSASPVSQEKVLTATETPLRHPPLPPAIRSCCTLNNRRGAAHRSGGIQQTVTPSVKTFPKLEGSLLKNSRRFVRQIAGAPAPYP